MIGTTLKIGQELHGDKTTYRIESILGQGSFGITYLATTKLMMEGKLGRIETIVKVAIKEFFMGDLNCRSQDGSNVEKTSSNIVCNYLKKFQREAENLSKLHHPNIVRVLEVFDEHNTTYIGQTEVTQELWLAVMGSNPSFVHDEENLPVEKVSWNMGQEFIHRLNVLTGKQFRLPTEAEWEYAARGGSNSKGYKYCGSNTLSKVAWFCDNSDNRTHPVATKQPNELGLYDMSGNVWELCQDFKGAYLPIEENNPTGASNGSERVIRGGSLYDNSRSCRVASRSNIPQPIRNYNVGLRLVLPFTPQTPQTEEPVK